MNERDKEDNELEIGQLVYSYLFEEEGKQEITLSDFAQYRKRFNKIAFQTLAKNPGWVAIIVSAISGLLLLLWNAAIILLQYWDSYENEIVKSFITKTNDSVSWVALLCFILVIFLYVTINTWTLKKYRERKYPEESETSNEMSCWQKITGIIWKLVVLVVISLNSILIQKIAFDNSIKENDIWIVLLSICLVINAYHFWTLLRYRLCLKHPYFPKTLFVSILLSMLFILTGWLISLLFVPSYEISKCFIDPIFIFVFFYSCIWMSFIGASYIGESLSHKTFVANFQPQKAKATKTIRYWIKRELKIDLVILVVISFCLIFAFTGWVIVTANLFEAFSPFLSNLLNTLF